jgi:hypothetical protein
VDMDAKVRSADIQVSEITRAIWSLTSDKNELRMEEQISSMWNNQHLMMAKRPQSNYFGNWPRWNDSQASFPRIVEETGQHQLQEVQILGIGPESY